MANARAKREADNIARKLADDIARKITEVKISAIRDTHRNSISEKDKQLINQTIISKASTVEYIEILIDILSMIRDASERLNKIERLNKQIDLFLGNPRVDSFLNLHNYLEERCSTEIDDILERGKALEKLMEPSQELTAFSTRFFQKAPANIKHLPEKSLIKIDSEAAKHEAKTGPNP